MGFDCPPDILDRDLVLAFFWKFSVFECALKREGFLRVGRNDSAEADWNKFAREIEGKFEQVDLPGFKEAIAELLRFSPRRQVVRDGRLGWDLVKQGAQESNEGYILRLLKTSRNNLFHGGKYPDGPIDEIARDRAILSAAMTILSGCYEIHSGLKRWLKAA